MSLSCKERKRIIGTMARLFGHPPNVDILTDDDIEQFDFIVCNRVELNELNRLGEE